MVANLAVYVFLCSTFIDEHKLAILPEERKVPVRDSDFVPITTHGCTPVNAVLNNIDNGKMKRIILYETCNDAEKNSIASTVVRVIKQLVLEPQLVGLLMVETKQNRLLHLHTEYHPDMKGFLSAKRILKALPNLSCFIL